MIMTAAQFHKRKAVGHTVHKNPYAQDIYTLLQAYEAANTPNKEMKILVLIYFLCLQYELAKFGTRDKTSKTGMFKKTNMILLLKEQIETEMDSPAFKQKYANKLAGESYKGGVQRAAAGNGTQLKGAYGIESIAPRANDANKYGLSTQIPAFGMSLLTQEMEMDFQTNHGMGGTQSSTAAHNKITNMTMSELFKQMHELWSNVNVGGMSFKFFDSTDRQQYLATYVNGAWTCNNKTPYTTGHYPSMYIMDMAHNMYFPDGIRTGGGEFNHSSMLAGKPVLCAGEVTINGAGRMTHIDNNSGHYKPDKNALKQVVKVLLNEYRIPAMGLWVTNQVNQERKSAALFLVA
jgi:hypothetical protein